MFNLNVNGQSDVTRPKHGVALEKLRPNLVGTLSSSAVQHKERLVL